MIDALQLALVVVLALIVLTAAKGDDSSWDREGLDREDLDLEPRL